MRKRATVNAAIFFLCPVLFFLTGCGQPMVKDRPVQICPCGEVNKDPQAVLNMLKQDKPAVRARGKVRFTYYEKGKLIEKEEPDFLMIFVPSYYLYFKADILGQEVILLGANQREYWLRFKPKEIDSYIWAERDSGRYGRDCLFSDMSVSPEIIFDVMGIIERTPEMYFNVEDGFEVVTLEDALGGVIKKIYISCCDNRISRIEYFDVFKNRIAVAETYGYAGADVKGYPGRIRVEQSGRSGNKSVMEMRFSGKREYEPTKKAMEKLFTRPEPAGIGDVYKVDENCEFIRIQ